MQSRKRGLHQRTPPLEELREQEIRRSMREPSVASTGAQIAAEMPKAAINMPACSMPICNDDARSRSTGRRRSNSWLVTKKLPAVRTTRCEFEDRRLRHSDARSLRLQTLQSPTRAALRVWRWRTAC